MLRYTRHALEAMAAREIAIEWIEAAVSAPDRVEPDPRDPECIRSYRSIGPMHNPQHPAGEGGDGDIPVVTAHLDRRARR